MLPVAIIKNTTTSSIQNNFHHLREGFCRNTKIKYKKGKVLKIKYLPLQPQIIYGFEYFKRIYH